MRIPHPERILYPEAGISRAEVVSYYAEVAPYLLQQARGRPLTIKRWPHGIAGPMFYQKHPVEGEEIFVNTRDDLLTWVGQGALEWHAPLGVAPNLLNHDWAVLDLDPNPPAGWKEVLAVARVFKTLLDLLQVPFLLKTSGQRGLHFYFAIEPLDHRRVMDIIGQWAAMVVETVPDLATVARLKRDRGARIYLDYLQNGFKRTTVMAYSLRATPNATVSMPIRWEEADLGPDYWTMDRVRDHLHRYGNGFIWTRPRIRLLDVIQQSGQETPMRGLPGPAPTGMKKYLSEERNT